MTFYPSNALKRCETERRDVNAIEMRVLKKQNAQRKCVHSMRRLRETGDFLPTRIKYGHACQSVAEGDEESFGLAVAEFVGFCF